ncbi:MAG: hypothetical protein DA407_09480 [Bacteroidetes bacterium]|nr:MAG: hypothetical protein DA407_09480 [Bacteroidota bacterium]
MKKYYFLTTLFLTLFSVTNSFAEACPDTAFTTGSAIYAVYPVGTSACIDRPMIITVGASTFTRLICEDGYSYYQLSSGAPVTPTDPFTIDTGFDTSCTYEGGTLGIEDIGIINRRSIKIFPNPLLSTDDKLNITFAINTSASISIYDLTGKIVLKESINNLNSKQVNISNLNRGIYMMKIETQAFSLTRKVIIMK